MYKSKLTTRDDNGSAATPLKPVLSDDQKKDRDRRDGDDDGYQKDGTSFFNLSIGERNQLTPDAAVALEQARNAIQSGQPDRHSFVPLRLQNANSTGLFDAAKVTEITNKLGDQPGYHCAHTVCDMIQAGGVNIARQGTASAYVDVLPQYGFQQVTGGSGETFNVNQVRAEMGADASRPIIVVMTSKDPNARGLAADGHIFYVDADGKTYSDFAQTKSVTGLANPHDYNFHAFAYSGQVANYGAPGIVTASATTKGPSASPAKHSPAVAL